MNRWTFIRQLAMRTLDDFKHTTGVEPFSTENGSHVIARDLALACFGLTVITDRTLPEHTEGELNMSEGTITYHPDLLPLRVPLVIVHEIGHAALKHPFRDAHQDTGNEVDDQARGDELRAQNGVQPAYNTRDRWELEANVFALELLAPASQIRKRMTVNPEWTVREFATYFGLSESAMNNQLAAVLLCNPINETNEREATIQISTSATGEMPVAEVGGGGPVLVTNKEPMDDDQRVAAQAPAPALVIAGPGAGKTRVLIERFLYLVNRGLEPRAILALTFSNKAAAEMRERLCAALPTREYEVNVFTFHSFGLQLLMSHGHTLGYERIQVLSQADAFVFLRDRLKDLPLGCYESLTSPTRFLDPLIGAFSRAKDELCDPSHFLHLAQEWLTDLESCKAPSNSSEVAAMEKEKQKAAECVDAALVYEAYQSLLKEHGFLDYGDLIAQSVALFSDAALAQQIRGDYDAILVDEFQDINYASGRLVKALDGGAGKIWAVGDPRQNIYGFRGASRANIANFQADYPGAKTLKLGVNYRSVDGVVQAGQAVQFPLFEDEHSFFPTQLVAKRPSLLSQPAVRLGTAPNTASEIAALAQIVNDLLGEWSPGDIAVLCRSNAIAQNVSRTLEGRGIATNWGGHLEDRTVFKDLMGVLLLASDDPQGLLRLSRLPEHRFCEADLRLLMKAARKGNSALSALYAATQGEIESLSEDGLEQAKRSKALALKLRTKTDAWGVLSCYLFECAQWPRALFADETLEARRTLATAGQLANLAREFSLKDVTSGESGAAAFVDYIRSCRRNGCLDCTDTTHVLPGAVTVSTIHKSKGLEWPVVVMPGVTNKHSPTGDKVSLPPGLSPGYDSTKENDAYDHACVFYVGLTRARDTLILTRALKSDGKRALSLSPHYEELVASLVPRENLQVFEIEAIDDDIVVDQAKAGGRQSWSLPDPIPYRMLERYETCGQQFKYRYIYSLPDSDKGYALLHSVLYGTIGWINEQIGAECAPSNAEIEVDLEQRWEAVLHQQTDVRFDELYRRGALEQAVAFARRMTPGKPVLLRVKKQITIANHLVEVTVDEIEQGPPSVLRQHKLGRRSSSHSDSSILALLKQIGDDLGAAEIRLSYLKEEESCKKGKTFNANRIKKVEANLELIEKGVFKPSPNEIRCASCAFNLICPA